MKIKCGIYKITNPKGSIYVGKSKNILSRFKDYKRIDHNNGQNKLYNSLKKYGYINHLFQIIEECSVEQLNEREIYWIKFFNSFHHENKKFGLNLTKGGEGGNGILRSEATKKLHSIKTTGKIRNDNHKNNVSKALKGIAKPKEFGKDYLGKKNTERTSLPKIKKEKNPNHYLTNKKRPDWVNKKIREGMALNKKPKSIETIKKMRENNCWSKPIIQCDLNGIDIKEWISQAEAARYFNIDSTGIYACCKGKQKTAAGFKWKYK